MLRSALRRSMTSGSGRASPEPWKRRKGSVVLSPAAAALAAALSALARLYRVARAHVRRGILNDASADVTVISCGAVARLVHACGPEAALGARLDLVHHAPDHALGVATFVASQRGAHEARATLEGGGAGSAARMRTLERLERALGWEAEDTRAADASADSSGWPCGANNATRRSSATAASNRARSTTGKRRSAYALCRSCDDRTASATKAAFPCAKRAAT